MTDINKEYEKEYYDEYRNNYYNPDDDDAEPGINLNWKRIQKGFHSVAAGDQETDETLYEMQANLETLNTDVETLKTDVEEIKTSVDDLNTAVETAEQAAEAAAASEAAAEAAQAAIEERAESRPEDYTELSDDVSELKDIIPIAADKTYLTIEIGTIISGYPSSHANYVRAKYFYAVNKGDVIHFAATNVLYRVVVYIYGSDSSGNLLKTEEFDVTANGSGYDYVCSDYGYAKFRLTYVPTRAMTADDVTLFSRSVSYISSPAQRKAYDDRQPVPDYFVKTIAHRGYYNAPENTLIAYKMAQKYGYEYAETDVRFTSDGVAVLLHDATINRTARNADGSDISGTINITDITYEQAVAYDYGAYKGADYVGTQIPTFSEYVALCRKIGLKPVIELKAGTEAQITALYDTVKSYGIIEDVIWVGEGTYLTYIKNISDTATLCYVTRSTNIGVIAAFKTGKNKVIAMVEESAMSSAVVSDCITNDLELGIWTINIDSSVTNADPYIKWFISNKPIAGIVLYNDAMGD